MEFEWRLVSCTTLSEHADETTHTFKAEKRRLRYRLLALSVISVGETLLRCEWRKKGEDEWRRSKAFWPIVIEFKEKPVAEQIVSSLEK